MTALLPQRLRPFIARTSLVGKRGALVLGARGVGKTTLLLREAARADVLYVSVDSPLLATISLSELADEAFAAGFKGIVFDEVHHADQWSKHCKAIYDSHPNRCIWISDSSSVMAREGVADLSRRFPQVTLPFLSFPEYLALKHEIAIEALDPFSCNADAVEDALKKTDILAEFSSYKRVGLRPIFLEGDYEQKILAIIEKTIFTDIPFLVPQIQENYIRLMNSVIGYLATATVPTLHIEALSTQWGLGKEKLYRLLAVMEQASLITIVRFKSDRHVMTKGAKIFLADPTMYQALGGIEGNVREALVVTMFRQCGKEIYACKDERSGDFVVNSITLEVGGRDKERKGADFVIRDGIERASFKTIPLWVIASMYGR